MEREIQKQKTSLPNLNEPILYIVATPIGNLDDITFRAVSVLKAVDYILSEDTRTTLKLLRHFEIKTRLKSYRQHQKESDISWALQNLKQGKSIALVSEAGTPGISDPASDLVRKARENHFDCITPIPGPSSLAAALSVCGWKTNPALFTGFLSPKKSKRKKSLEEYHLFSGVIVIYESVHRVQSLLDELRGIFPNRDIFIAREISKFYEEFILIQSEDSSKEICTESRLKNIVRKGEFTVVLSPPQKKLS